ncbi:MAG: hypothetical protein AAF416_14170 [Pseudomonadota bacterium]
MTARSARARFLLRCRGLMRVWLCLIGAGIVVALIGIAPSVVIVMALMGVVWVPIVVLVFWGRLLDDMVPVRRVPDDE